MPTLLTSTAITAVQLKESSSPGTPSSGFGRLYYTSAKALHLVDSTGTDLNLSAPTVLGTVATGTWNATTIGVAYGGTGLTSLTANQIPYGNGTGALQSSANLTFDGTTLAVTGGISATAKTHTWTDATSGGDTIFALQNSSATNGRSVAFLASVKNAAGTQSSVSIEAQSIAGANADMWFRTSGTGTGLGTAYMTLSSAGLLTVSGTAGSAYKAAFINGTATSNGVLINAGNAVGDYSLRVQNYNAGVDLFIVRGNGDAYIANVLTIGALASGSLTSASGVITSSSDETMKDILPGSYPYGLPELRALAAAPHGLIRYHWNAESGLPTREQFGGMGAQTAHAFIPESGFRDPKTGKWGFDGRPWLGAAINGIVQMDRAIDELAARLAALEAR